MFGTFFRDYLKTAKLRCYEKYQLEVVRACHPIVTVINASSRI